MSTKKKLKSTINYKDTPFITSQKTASKPQGHGSKQYELVVSMKPVDVPNSTFHNESPVLVRWSEDKKGEMVDSCINSNLLNFILRMSDYVGVERTLLDHILFHHVQIANPKATNEERSKSIDFVEESLGEMIDVVGFNMINKFFLCDWSAQKGFFEFKRSKKRRGTKNTYAATTDGVHNYLERFDSEKEKRVNEDIDSMIGDDSAFFDSIEGGNNE